MKEVNIKILKFIEWLLIPLFVFSVVYIFKNNSGSSFVGNLNSTIEGISLGIISSAVFYFFTVYIPNKINSKKIEYQFFLCIFDLRRILFEIEDSLKNIKVCNDKNIGEFNNLSNKYELNLRNDSKDWNSIFSFNIKMSIEEIDNKIKLVDQYIDQIQMMNNFYINNVKIYGWMSFYKEMIAKRVKYKNNNINQRIKYYECIISSIKEIDNIYSDKLTRQKIGIK